jgi:hypothetical protein
VSGDHAMLPGGAPAEHTDGHEPRHGRQRPRIFGRRRQSQVARLLADVEPTPRLHCLKLWPVDGRLTVALHGDQEIVLLTKGPIQRVSPHILVNALQSAEEFREGEVGAIVASAVRSRYGETAR